MCLALLGVAHRLAAWSESEYHYKGLVGANCRIAEGALLLLIDDSLVTQGESCYLRDGDMIALLPSDANSFNFKVTLDEPKPEPMEHAAAPVENPAKRRLQPLSEDDADDIIDSHAGKKARQDPDSSKSARPPCRYGGGCYQKNPDHKRKFAHPGDKDYDTTPSTHVQASRVKANAENSSPPSSPHPQPSVPAPKPQSQPSSQPSKSQLPVRVVHDAHNSVPSGSPPTKVAAPRLLAVPDADNAEDDPSLKKLKTLDEARKGTVGAPVSPLTLRL